MSYSPLSDETEFTLPDGFFDLRGWEVRSMADGEKIGSVEDLILDEGGSVRYLEVGLSTERRRTLIPIERASADEAEMVVWLPGLRSRDLDSLPTYEGSPAEIDAIFEAEIEEAYRPPAPPAREVVIPSIGALASLSEIDDYDIAPGSQDPRGWDLRTRDGTTVGVVHDLIIEPAAGKARFLDIEVTYSGRGEHPAAGRHILIPLTAVRLEPESERAIVEGITADEIAVVPSYPGLPLGEEELVALYTIFPITGRVEDRERG